MKTISVLLIVILMLSALAVAQENSTTNTTAPAGQKAIVVLDMNNKTGNLVYKEEYYSLNNSGGLQFDKARIFFRGNVNLSRLKMQIIRPLDGNGNYYNESMIKAIATLDNKTILNAWYKGTMAKVNSTDKASTPSSTKTSPGFEGIVFLIAVVCFVIVLQKRLNK
jgi:hypothetical protein